MKPGAVVPIIPAADRRSRCPPRGLIFQGKRVTLRVPGRGLSNCDCPRLPKKVAVSAPLSAPEILNREFLEIRCKILDLAAAFDRLQRAEGALQEDPRLKLLQESLAIVSQTAADRAEQVQLLFSREYDQEWQSTFQVKPR